jgi:hypothetical protein
MKLFTGILLLSCSCSSAMAADQCIRSLPDHRNGHWHYRYVAGEKCWYGPGAESIRLRQSYREDRRAGGAGGGAELGPRRQKEVMPDRPPAPVASLAAEEERDEPSDPTVRRVRVIPFTVPVSASRRIQQTFEELVDHCQVSASACEAFLH